MSQPINLSRKSIYKFLALISALMIVLASCGDTVPVKKLTDAKKAIMSAEKAGANIYAPKKLQEARAALHLGHEQVEKDEKDKAAEKADEAKKLAELALIITQTKVAHKFANDTRESAQNNIVRAENANAQMYAPEKLKEAKDKYAIADKDLAEQKKELDALDNDNNASYEQYKKLEEKLKETGEVAKKSNEAAKEAYNICAQEVPKIRQNINDIEKTIVTAESLGGNKYAPEKLQTARNELANAKNMTNEMKLKLALRHMENAKTNADEALILTQKKRAEEKISQAVDYAGQAEKSVAADYKKDQLNGAKESLSTAQKSMEENRYNDAYSHADESIRLSKEVIGAEPEYIAMMQRKNQQAKGKTLEEQKKEYEAIIAFWDRMEKDGKTHTVKWNKKYRQTLWRISVRFYKDARLWPRIYRLNQDKINDPDMIYPNQKLIIPPKDLLIPNNLVSKKEAKEKLAEVNQKIEDTNKGGM